MDAVGCVIVVIETKTFELDVKFATASSQLEDNSEVEVKALAEFLKEFPESQVEISGHTDSRGSATYNKQLSQARCDAVRSILIDSFAIEPERVAAVGYGEGQPVASNETVQGRQLNHRVVGAVKVSYQKQ